MVELFALVGYDYSVSTAARSLGPPSLLLMYSCYNMYSDVVLCRLCIDVRSAFYSFKGRGVTPEYLENIILRYQFIQKVQ